MPLWSGKFKSCADTASRDSAGTAETVPLHRLRASAEVCFSLPGELSVPSTLPSSLALTPGPPEVRLTAQVGLPPRRLLPRDCRKKSLGVAPLVYYGEEGFGSLRAPQQLPGCQLD